MEIKFFDGVRKNANWIGSFFILLGVFGFCFNSPEGIFDGSYDRGFFAFVYVLFKPFGILKTGIFFISLGCIIIVIKNRKLFKR